MHPCLPLKRFPDAATLHAALQAAGEAGRSDIVTGTACAWYLRQFDTALVIDLAQTLLSNEALAHVPPSSRPICHGYLHLSLAEAYWLSGNADTARMHLRTARDSFGEVGDQLGSCDADWAEANFAHDVGAVDERQRRMRQSLGAAEDLGDLEREASCIVALACFDTLVDPEAAKSRWHDKVAPHLGSHSPALQAFANQFMFLVKLSEGVHHQAIEHAMASQRASRQCGLRRRAIFAASNVALSFTDLGDMDSSLTWLESALEEARACGWPHPLGYCLSAMSNALLKTGRGQAALAVAREAVAVLANFADTTEYVSAMTAMGDAALACQDFELARTSYVAVSLPDCPSEYPKARHYGLLGLAQIAERSGDLSEARRLGFEALDTPAAMPDHSIDVQALRLLSRVLHRAQAPSVSATTPDPIAADTRRALAISGAGSRKRGPAIDRADPLHLLAEAIALTDDHLDGAGRHALLVDTARILEERGHHQEALAVLKESIASLLAEKEKSASRLSLSLEVRFRTERVLAESELHKRIAATEAARAADLESVNQQLQAAVDSLREAQELLVRRNEELSNAHAQITDLSLTDPLTGMRNRRFLSQAIDTAVAESLRSYGRGESDAEQRARTADRKDIVFFLLDLDHFKRVNDEFGHGAGDAVLVQLRDRLRMVTRDQDFLVRWGGEEFLVAVCGIDRAEAPTIAERLRLSVSSIAFEIGKGVRISKTVSIGFASFPVDRDHPTAASWEQAVEIADARLYSAKHGGRDRWVGDQFGTPSEAPSAAATEGASSQLRDIASPARNGR